MAAGTLDYIVIKNAAGGAGSPISNCTLNVGATLHVWAAGYDSDGVYLRDVPVTWTGTGVVDSCLVPTKNTNTIFTANATGTGTIRANDGAGHSDQTGQITVESSSVQHIWSALKMVASGFWSALSFGLALCTLLLYAPGVFEQLNTLLQPIASIWVARPLIVLCVFIATFYMASVGSDLYRRQQTSRYGEEQTRSIAIWALLCFVLGIVLAFMLAFGVSAKDSIVAPPGMSQLEIKGTGLLVHNSLGHMLLKLVMTGILFLIPVLIAISAALMAVRSNGKRQENNGPPPAYKDTGKLKRLVLDALREDYEFGEPEMIMGLKRLGNGGIEMTLAYREEFTGDKGAMFEKEKVIQVTADYTGTVNRIEEKKTRTIAVQDKEET